jgi:hypothetical protein
VIGKISAPRGKRVEPLIRYLFGPGRREEHTDPHIVAGWRHPAELEPPLRADGTRDFRRINGLLNQPNDARGNFAYERPMWHCALRAAPEDKTLSDDEWARIAHDVMNRTGLSHYGEENEAVRWFAVWHARDHIHLVAMLARQDGRHPSLSNERYRVRDACRAAERKYGLRSTAPADRTAPRRPTRAETEKAGRRGLEEAPRLTLRRAVTTAAAASSTAAEFFARLDAAGITVRQRHSAKNPGQVTGYAVALPGDATKDGNTVWYSGGKLAADLTGPKLAHRWAGPGPAPVRPVVTAAERTAIWNHAGRAARAPFGRVPARSPAGDRLRQSARLLGALAYLSRDPANLPLMLLVQLAALVEAAAELREAQRHAAQAAAALAAATHLRTAARSAAPRPATPARPATAVQLAATAFPKTAPGRGPAAGRPRPGQDPPRPARRPPPPRPRGPAR